MANISDNVSKAYQDGSDPIKAGADNLQAQYQKILKAGDYKQANAWLNKELADPAIQKYLPEFAAIWGEEKDLRESRNVYTNDLEKISTSSDNGYDKEMASTLLQMETHLETPGHFETGFLGNDGDGTSMPLGGFTDFERQDGEGAQSLGADDPSNANLNQIINLNVDPTLIATATTNASTDLKLQSADKDRAAAAAAQAAQGSIPQGEAVPAPQVLEQLDYQQALKTNVAASADEAQATRIDMRSGEQEIKAEDGLIAKNGIATGNGLDVYPGPNAIAGGKINKTDLGETATPDTDGGTTNDTTKVGDNCSESVTSQYKAQAGDTLWGIAAKMMKVPNDKAHAPAIYRMAQLLETMNPGLKPHHIRLGETIDFASLDDQG